MCIATPTRPSSRKPFRDVKNQLFPTLRLDNFLPQSTDILCGRGNVFSNHAGNQYFQRIVRSHMAEYAAAPTQTSKAKVVHAIYRQMKCRGCRFAKLDHKTKEWHQLNDVQAREKIGHAIRDRIRLDSNKNKQRPRKAAALQKRQQQAMSVPSSMSSMIENLFEPIRCDSVMSAPVMSTPEIVSSALEIAQESLAEIEVFRLPSGSRQRTTGGRRSSMRRSVLILENEHPEEGITFSAATFFV